MGLPGGGVDSIKRNSQGNLQRDLSHARGQQIVSLDSFDDLSGIANLGEKSLYHWFDLG